jgi:hypothetical protein
MQRLNQPKISRKAGWSVNIKGFACPAAAY